MACRQDPAAAAPDDGCGCQQAFAGARHAWAGPAGGLGPTPGRAETKSFVAADALTGHDCGFKGSQLRTCLES